MILTDEDTSRQLSTIYSAATDAGLGFMLAWKGAGNGFPSRFFADVEPAGAFAAARAADGSDVWTSVALYCEAPPEGSRGDAKSAAGLVGFFADLDVKDGAFETKEDARRFIETEFWTVPPSMVIDSGTGLHVWFLFH